MTLPDRDRLIVQYVARFNQLTRTQIFDLVFDTSSQTPCDRALKRLVERRYLVAVERRAVGGRRGGSGQYVYALGLQGHKLHYTHRYSPDRTVNYHSLAVADVFVLIKQLQSAGRVRIVGYSTEPDCHVTIGRNELKPDLYLDLQRDGRDLKLWVEMDMATQGQRQIKEKFERYWRAYNTPDDAWPVFPLVVFVGIDQERADELTWLLGQGPKEALPLFRVTTVEVLPSLLG